MKAFEVCEKYKRGKRMKTSKTLILMAVGVLLLNGCDKVTSLVSSGKTSAGSTSSTTVPKNKQSFLSRIFGSSTSTNVSTPTSNVKNR